MIEAAEKVEQQGREIAAIGHASRHNVHIYNFDQDPKCPDVLCMDARKRLQIIRQKIDEMKKLMGN